MQYERAANVLLLSARDSQRFLSALEAPPEPSENLKKAFSEYRKNRKTYD